MPTPPRDDAALRRVYEAVRKAGSVMAAARLMQMNRRTAGHYYQEACSRFGLPDLRADEVRFNGAGAKARSAAPIFDTLPDEDIPIEEEIEQATRRFEARIRHRDAAHNRVVTFATDEPIGVLVFGDPHLDDNGCNWPLLKRHIEIANRPGVYGFQVGDVANNWPEKMGRL